MRKTIYGIVLKKYLSASKEDKSQMINNVVGVTGLNRKSVIRGLRNAQMKEPWTEFSGEPQVLTRNAIQEKGRQYHFVLL